MNRFFSLAILFLLSNLSLANPITQQQALRKANDFATKRMRSATGQLRLAHVGRHEGNAAWYAFNMTGKKGFVIVSGSDQTDAILGYSDQGEFDYDHMPENMKVWLEQYGQSVEAVAKGAMRPARSTTYTAEAVEPLITSLWGQKWPYNSQCPTANSRNCPVGCTAVAMAQVMRYHKFPTSSCNAIPAYTTPTLGLEMPELPETTFDWEKMPDEVTDETPQESIDELAKLMLYCGQAAKMDYTASGSGAYTDILSQRLPEYFNYAKTIHYVQRRSYTEHEWDSLLVRELVNGRPVIYTAYTNLTQGHTFVCDGYDGQGLFHINWGWLGAGNGFYRISVACAEGENLDENIKNYQLSIMQTALLGVKPSGSDDYVAPSQYYRVFTRPSIKDDFTYKRTAKKNDFSGITVKQSFINTTSSKKTLYSGWAICDDDGKIVSVLDSASVRLSSGNVRAFELSNKKLGAGLVGHYMLKVVYKPSSTSDWIPMGGADQNYVDMEITTRELTLTPVPKANFVVKGLRMEDDVLVVSLENNDEDFYGPVYLRKMVPATEQITQVSYDYLSAEAGTSQDFGIYIDPKKNFDLYNDEFYLSADEYDTHYFYTNLSEENSHLDKTVEILNLDEDSVTIVGDRIMCRVVYRNNSEKVYNNYISVSSLDYHDNLQEGHSELVSIEPGDSVVVHCDAPLTDFSALYAVVASSKRNLFAWDSDTTYLMPVEKGAIYWTKDGTIKTKLAAPEFQVPEDALAINLRNAYTSNVVPNGNPNTIYMLDRTIPSGLTSSNFVNASNKGSKLVLVDGYDYYFPVEMSFSGTVSYQRMVSDTVTFCWSTLSLPFTPDNVLADDDYITYYSESEEEDGDFWLFDFEGVENDTVRTSYSHIIQANVPYLMAFDERLAGKTITFQTQKCVVESTVLHPTVSKGEASLIGTNARQTLGQGYILQGKEWVKVEQNLDSGDATKTTDDSDDSTETTDDSGDTVGNQGDDAETSQSTSPIVLESFKAYLLTTSETAGVLAIDAEKIIHPQSQPEVLLGDANNDGYINMSDVTVVINYILGVAEEAFVFANADVVDDGFINMSDVSAIIGIILGN